MRGWGLALLVVWGWLGIASDVVGSGIPLTGTPNAPPGATGTADISPGTISLELEGLTPRIYQVQAVLKSSRGIVTLAWVEVVDPDWQPSAEAGDSGIVNQRSSAHQAVVLKTQAQLSLPPGFPVADIESIAVADTAGCQWLVGQVP